jgi:hypothetical protein
MRDLFDQTLGAQFGKMALRKNLTGNRQAC